MLLADLEEVIVGTNMKGGYQKIKIYVKLVELKIQTL
jgi:hypothetical protein